MTYARKANYETVARQFHALKPDDIDEHQRWCEMIAIVANQIVPHVWRKMFINACIDGKWDESLNGVL